MDDGDFETVFLLGMATLATGLRSMMDARPLADDEDPDGDEKPEEVKTEKVVAIGGEEMMDVIECVVATLLIATAAMLLFVIWTGPSE